MPKGIYTVMERNQYNNNARIEKLYVMHKYHNKSLLINNRASDRIDMGHMCSLMLETPVNKFVLVHMEAVGSGVWRSKQNHHEVWVQEQAVRRGSSRVMNHVLKPDANKDNNGTDESDGNDGYVDRV